jgi:spoIIIJ-associated protein
MKIEDYLIKLCKHVGLTEDQFTVEIDDGEEMMSAKISLPEEESGLFIGYHGETLQAIQRMIRISFFDLLKDKGFQLNVNDYREQREEQLTERVKEIAGRVLETGESYTFSYLTAQDRYLIHTILSDNEELAGLTSKSEGEGKQRYLTIFVKTEDE